MRILRKWLFFDQPKVVQYCIQVVRCVAPHRRGSESVDSVLIPFEETDDAEIVDACGGGRAVLGRERC